MPTRQYIGARYVPKFFEGANNSSEWVGNTAYEALTIVTRNGNSYTSKKPVPSNVGAPESNPEYWASTGIFNQQVEAYKEEVDALKMRVGSKYLFVGDSYDLIYNDVKWSDVCANLLGLGNDDYHITAHGGCGLSPSSAQNMPWQTLITNDSDIPTDIDTIIIGGGTNDVTVSYATLLNAATNLDSYLKGRFSNLKKIYLSFMSVWYLSNTTFNNACDTCGYYAKICEELGWIFTSGVESVLLDPELINYSTYSDKVHPTKTGVKYLGRAVYQSIVGGYAKVSVVKDVTVTVNSALNFEGTKTLRFRTFNNDVKVYDSLTSFGGSSEALSDFVTLYTLPTMTVLPPINFFQPVGVKYGSTTILAYIMCYDLNTISIYLAGNTIPANTPFTLMPWKLEACYR